MLDAHLATSAFRSPGRYLEWKRRSPCRQWGEVFYWARALLNSNPLRQARLVWARLCASLPELEFVSYVLDHGVAVVLPTNRPSAFSIPNHGSCKDARLASIASAVLGYEEVQGFIAVSPPLLRPFCSWIHPLGILLKGSDKCRIIHDCSAPSVDSIKSRIEYVRTSYDIVDGAFRAIKSKCFLAKIDITAFFRHIL